MAGVILICGIFFHAQGQSFPTNGLVAYYTFNGNTTDLSVNNWTTFASGVTPDLGRFGEVSGSLRFNGSNSIVQFQSSNTIAPTHRTISTWVKFNNLSRFEGPPYGQEWACILSDDKRMVFYFTSTTNVPRRLYFDEGSGYYQYASMPSIQTNVWYQMSATYNSANVVFYLNGKPITTLPLSGFTQNGWGGNFVIGANGDGYYYLDGNLSGFKIFDRDLSVNEIWQLYVNESAPILNIRKAVYVDTSNLWVGANYQLQVSTDLFAWTNSGASFTATNSTWRSTNYWDVDNWDSLFFRLKTNP